MKLGGSTLKHEVISVMLKPVIYIPSVVSQAFNTLFTRTNIIFCFWGEVGWFIVQLEQLIQRNEL